jgi:hypothetical protein
MKQEKYALPVEKIKAVTIARIEGVSYHRIFRVIKAGHMGDYWERPLRVRKDMYIQWQNQNRKN